MLHTILPFIYTIGPLAYLYLSIVTSVNFTWKKKYVFHFLPLLVSIIVGLKYWILTGEEKIEIFMLIYKGEGAEYTAYSLGPGLLLIFAYLVLISYENNPFINMKNHQSWMIGGLLLFWVMASAISTVSVFAGNTKYLPFTGVFTTISIIYLFLLSQRYPDLLYNFGRALRKKKYDRSLLHSVNTGSLSENLHILMTDEKIYRNDTLNLKETASMLRVSSHQLSQLLNEIENKNFNGFINAYRIKEAKELIQEDPSKRIITVAYDVGFNSVSAFNTAFHKYTNLTPTQYKKNSAKA
ncbi:MAG: helix-turn-helix domain-containing protein [Leptospirales bacterium]